MEAEPGPPLHTELAEGLLGWTRSPADISRRILLMRTSLCQLMLHQSPGLPLLFKCKGCRETLGKGKSHFGVLSASRRPCTSPAAGSRVPAHLSQTRSTSCGHTEAGPFPWPWQTYGHYSRHWDQLARICSTWKPAGGADCSLLLAFIWL